MAISIYRKREVLFHAAFWVVYIPFIVTHIASYHSVPRIQWGRVVWGSSISISYLVALSYLNYFYFIPRFLLRKKTGRFIAAFAASFLVLTLFRVGVETLAFGKSWKIASPDRTQMIIESTISDLFIVFFIGLLRFASDWLELDSRRRQLETEKLNAELKFLKAQVNPHFLFNTLNNLYYLSTIKSDTAPLVIAKLSEVMRYMIYDSNQEMIQLAKEIEYMQHYISLERLRLKEGVLLDFNIVGNTDLLIAPLILISFLENAFKHGVTGGNDQCWIKARLTIDEDHLVYSIANSKVGIGEGKREGDGVGLKNVKRRLDLSYPQKHQLHIDDRDASYSVVLTIDRS
jgi:two-component system, LytTR family, sensor histidine kinase AlgZ